LDSGAAVDAREVPVIGRATRIILSVVIVGLSLWATVAALWGGPGDTISEHVRDYAAQYPVLAVALGVLVGHWAWPMTPAQPRDHLAPKEPTQ
jgi:hypothetical protein